MLAIKLRIALCDDCIDDIQKYKQVLETLQIRLRHTVEVDYYTECSTLLHQYETRLRPYDIIFLDVYMPEMLGFELARKVRDKDPAIRVAYISSDNTGDTVRRGYGTNAVDYIFKSSDLDELLSAFERILLTYIENRAKSDFTLQVEYETHVVNARDIIVAIAHRFKKHFYLANGTMLISNVSFRDLQPIFDANHIFEVVRGTYVNLRYIKRYSRKEGDHYLFLNRTHDIGPFMTDRIKISKRRFADFENALAHLRKQEIHGNQSF